MCKQEGSGRDRGPQGEEGNAKKGEVQNNDVCMI